MLFGFLSMAQYDYTQFRYADVDVRGLSINPNVDVGKKNRFTSLETIGSIWGLFSDGAANYFHFVNLPDRQARTDFSNYLVLNTFTDEDSIQYNDIYLNSRY